MTVPKFTVDTHLFSELGALLVGRDSTALNELVKNAYDADASTVTVHGEGLATAEGLIAVIDDGIGMTPEVFERGFLRIASREKTMGTRRSPLFGRRYTGRKGVGRLAAHKLASQITVRSTPDAKAFGTDKEGVLASIDWDLVEQHESLDDVGGGLQVQSVPASSSESGTTVELRKLRRSWSDTTLAAFVGEIQSFEAPEFLVAPIPETVASEPLLFVTPDVRDSSETDRGFRVRLSGEFDISESYWLELAERAQWILEIRATQGSSSVEYAVGPTVSETIRIPSARTQKWTYPHPNPADGPFFCARILIRGTRRVPGPLKSFARGAAGVRLFMEGFRVLPYGERGDDWLELDADYTRRREPFELGGLGGQSLAEPVENETFFRLSNSNYYGGVFLTDAGAPMLEMLVNREGFIPDAGFGHLKNLLRRGIDLSVRARAAAEAEAETTQKLAHPVGKKPGEESDSVEQRLETALATIETVRGHTKNLGEEGKGLDHDLERAASTVEAAQKVLSEARGEQQKLRVVASVGTQFAAFIHEINALLAQARSVEVLANRIAREGSIPRSARRTLGELRAAISELVQQLERQVSFLTDVVGANAQRRRRRLSVLDRVDIALQLLASRIHRRDQTLEIDIAADLRTPPMFSSELLSVLINVLSNAIKAAGPGGTILVQAKQTDTHLILQVANTGEAVDLADAERWFRPFESTTSEIDEVLGQGMGLGLPIVRRVLDEYGGSVEFVTSKRPYATTIQVEIPVRPR